VIGANVFSELLSLEGKVYDNLQALLRIEDVDTLLVDGISDKDFHGLFL
jgi:hypothetical protein